MVRLIVGRAVICSLGPAFHGKRDGGVDLLQGAVVVCQFGGGAFGEAAIRLLVADVEGAAVDGDH